MAPYLLMGQHCLVKSDDTSRLHRFRKYKPHLVGTFILVHLGRPSTCVFFGGVWEKSDCLVGGEESTLSKGGKKVTIQVYTTKLRENPGTWERANKRDKEWAVYPQACDRGALSGREGGRQQDTWGGGVYPARHSTWLGQRCLCDQPAVEPRTSHISLRLCSLARQTFIGHLVWKGHWGDHTSFYSSRGMKFSERKINRRGTESLTERIKKEL